MESKRKCDAADTANTSKKQKNNSDVNMDEDVIKYCLMPSLQHASTISVISTLWNQADIKHEIVKICSKLDNKKYCSADVYELFMKIGGKVSDKVLQLPVPTRIRKTLTNIVHHLGNEILFWIVYHHGHIFNTPPHCGNEGVKSMSVSCIDYLVWTSRGVIDYRETAKSILAKDQTLSDVHKYNLACFHCLEDDIAIIAPKVIGTTLNLWSFQRQVMVYFWTAHLTGDFTELVKVTDFYNRNHSTNYSANEWIFKTLLGKSPNKVAIKYMWDKLNSEEKARQIIPAIKKITNNDIRCFLLSQISKEQEKEVFKTHDAAKILLCFLDDWLWGHYFLLTIHHIWDIMSGWDYLHVLKVILHKVRESHEVIEKHNQYKATFKELWHCAPTHLKQDVFELENGQCFQHIFLNLFNKEDIDIVQLILADMNDAQKKKIIFSEYGVEKCSDYLTSDQWDLLEMLLGYTLSSGEDVERFKQGLIKAKGRELAVHFIQNKEWNKVERFLQWAFKSDNDIRKFKSQLAYGRVCDDILESIAMDNKADFMELEYFFKWCASGDTERVVELKTEIPQLYFEKVIFKLIEEGKYKLFNEILNWCFMSDPKSITQFKEYFYQDEYIDRIVELLVNLIKQDDQLQSFKEFVYCWCSTDEEINKLKTCILHPTQLTFGVCMRLLFENLFKLADEFVGWCYNSSQMQIANFKNQLMIHDYMGCLSDARDLGTSYETEVLKWFNPSAETIVRFKEKFKNALSLEDILSALDNYSQEQQHNQDRAINNDVNIILRDLLSAVANKDHNIINGK